MTDDKVRLHIQNQPSDPPVFHATDAVWRAAAARHPELAARLDVTIGWSAADLAAGLETAEVLITWTSVLRERFPTRAPRLRMIYCTSAGVDGLAPFDWLPPNCILVNNSGTHGPKAGEWGLMAILMLANSMPTHVANQRDRVYEKSFSSVVAGQTLVVLGLGQLASHTVTYAHGLGMRIIGIRTRPTPDPRCTEVVTTSELDRVLPEADYLLIACPLTPETRGLVSRARLASMKPTAGVINMARGAIIDQEALCDLLDEGRLGGAILDVVSPEPLPPDSRVWTTRNLILTPHVSSDDPVSYTPRSLDVFFDNLAPWLAGEVPPNTVDVTAGY